MTHALVSCHMRFGSRLTGLLGIGLVIGSCAPLALETDAPPPSTVPASAQVLGTPSAEGSSDENVTWTQTAALSGSTSVFVMGGIATASGVELYGSADGLAATWSSGNLREWNRQVFVGGRGEVVLSLASDGETRVAVTADEAADGEARALWTAPPNAGWQRLDPASAGIGAGSSANQVVWTGSTFAAAGSRISSGRRTAAVWTSPDARRWALAAGNEPGGRSSDLTVIAAGPGGLVAGGTSTGETADVLLLAASRPEGPWVPVTLDGLPSERDEYVTHVVASEDGWLAVTGSRRPNCGEAMCAAGDGATLTSRDGVAWDVVEVGLEPPSPFGTRGAEFLAFTPLDEGYQVVRSMDGFTWIAAVAPSPPHLGSERFVALGDRVLVTGLAIPDRAKLEIWVAPLGE